MWPKVGCHLCDDTEFVSWYLEDIEYSHIGNLKFFHDNGESWYSHPLSCAPEHCATRNKVLCEVYVALTDSLCRGSFWDMQNFYESDDMYRVNVDGHVRFIYTRLGL